MIKLARPVGVLIAAIAAIVPATAVFAAPAATSTTLYNSMVPAPGNLPSVGFEATQASEFGNAVTLTRSAKLATVVVAMDTWGCQTRPSGVCHTNAGAKFNEPITLVIYQAPAVNPTTQTPGVGAGLPGAVIVSVTKTFAIPFRPSQNNTKCQGDEAGDWFDAKLGECFPGMATNITFNLTSLKLTLPKNIVYGIAYNTSDYGATPYGDSTACHASTAGCGYDSLNVGLSYDPDNLNQGTDTYPGYIYWSTTTAGNYCDFGASGTGTFRFDSPSTPSCWSVDSSPDAPWYIPAVAFNAT